MPRAGRMYSSCTLVRIRVRDRVRVGVGIRVGVRVGVRVRVRVRFIGSTPLAPWSGRASVRAARRQ